jgi:AraC-like DNA-binding protein
MEISDRVGFTNYNYFYTAFKKFYGISPNKYRLNLNN